MTDKCYVEGIGMMVVVHPTLVDLSLEILAKHKPLVIGRVL